MPSTNISSRIMPYLLVMILLLPMFFIGIRDTHDWGDDFIAYIQGAQNLIHHQPLTKSKYVYFENYNYRYSPPAVPAGFPILLVPVIKFCGVDFKSLDYYMSFWLYLLAILSFAFLRRYISILSATCLTLICFLNPAVLAFKWEVLSDLPFAVFFILSLLLYIRINEKNRWSDQVLFGIAAAMLVSLRAIGACIFISIGIDLLWYLIHDIRQSQSPIRVFLLQLGKIVWIIPFIILYAFIFILRHHSAGSTYSFYSSTFGGIHVWEQIMANLTIYIQIFQSFFDHDAGIYGFSLLVTRGAVLFCFIIGFIATLNRGYSLVLCYFIIYTLVILVYPINNQGFRYFFPLWPVILLFIAEGAKSIAIPTFQKRYVWAPLVTLLILMQYKEDLRMMYKHQSDPIYPTPISADSKISFSHIHDLTTDDDLILSLKPKACAFFINRYFCVQPDGANAAIQSAKLAISKPNYLLVIKEVDYDRVDSLARFEKDIPVYEDAKFKLYKRHI